MSSSGEQCFSGGVDGTIQSWNMPNANVDPYDSYGMCPSPLSAPSGGLQWKCDRNLSPLQSPWSCGGRYAGMVTPCGAWPTAQPTTASFPAQLMGRCACGAQPTCRRLSLFSTNAEVRTLRPSLAAASLIPSQVSVSLRTRRPDVRRRGALRAGPHGDGVRQWPHWTLQHGDPAAGPDAGVGWRSG